MRKPEKSDAIVPSRDMTELNTADAAEWLGLAPKTLRTYREKSAPVGTGPICRYDGKGRAWYKVCDLDRWKHQRQVALENSKTAPREMTPEEKFADDQRRNKWAEEEDNKMIAWRKSLPPPETRYPARGKEPPFSLAPTEVSERYWLKVGPEWVVTARYNPWNRYHPEAPHIHKSETERGEKWVREQLPLNRELARSVRSSFLAVYGDEDPYGKKETAEEKAAREKHNKAWEECDRRWKLYKAGEISLEEYTRTRT